MNLKLLISILIFLTSCTFSSLSMFCGYQVDLVLADVGRQVAKKYNLDFSGIGGSLKDDKENILYIIFNYLGDKITIDESKKIIVNITEEIIPKFNQEIIKKSLKDELLSFPFTTENIHTTVFSFSEKGKRHLDPFIIYVESCEGKINIATKDPERPKKYKQEIEEPYIDSVIKYKGADYASTAVTCQIKGSEKESDKK